MAIIVDKQGNESEVDSTSWLLRHAKEVENFDFIWNQPAKHIEGTLIALLDDGTIYVSDFADIHVCLSFLNRPLFKGVKITVTNSATGYASKHEIGDEQYDLMIDSGKTFLLKRLRLD